MRRRAVRLAVLALGWVAVLAGPAGADPAEPGDVRSEVTAMTPAVEGVEAEVVGGDSFLRLRVDRGIEVVVVGYQEEPYLRVLADGTVEVNDRSPARWLNESRLGELYPDTADPAAAPEWRTIGGDGEAAWHDHRIHWMGNGRPRPPQQEWLVPVVVDGRPVSIEGRYSYVSPPSAAPWWIAAAVMAAVTGIAGWTRVRPAVPLVVVSGAVAGVVGAALLRLPSGTGTGVTVMVLAGLAVLGALVAARLRPPGLAGAGFAAAGAALVAYAGPRVDVLSHRVLVTELPAWFDRLSVALALGVGAAAAVTGVRAVLAGSRRRPEPPAPGAQLGGYQPPGTRASASGGPQEPRS